MTDVAVVADVAVIAIEADLGAARLLAQDLRAEGIAAEAMTPEAAAECGAAALVFFATPAALASAAWRGRAAMSAVNRYAAVLAVVVDEADLSDLAHVLPTDRITAPDARSVMRMLGDDLPEAPAEKSDAFQNVLESIGDLDDLEDIEEEEAPKADEPQSEDAFGAAPPRRSEEIRRERKAAPAAPPAARPSPTLTGGAPGGGAEAGEAAAIKRATLHENAPRRMRVGARREVVVRISAEKGAEAGMEGRVRAHQIMAAQVMTVTLDDPDFAFAIRPLTPATQWIDRAAVAQLGFLGAASTAEWRWSVEALKSGRNRLAITASARVADANGVSADAGLPPQVVSVRVVVSTWRILGQAARWAAVAVGAAVIGHYGVEIVDAAKALLE